jgi:lycopene cyclase domain-containing protein
VSYTTAAVIGVVVVVGIDVLVTRVRLVTRRAFWTAEAIIVGFQLVTNGILTGRDIVRYDTDAIIGWRIANAPVEDLLFGFALSLMTLTLWVAAGRRARHHALPTAAGRSSARGGGRDAER